MHLRSGLFIFLVLMIIQTGFSQTASEQDTTSNQPKKTSSDKKNVSKIIRKLVKDHYKKEEDKEPREQHQEESQITKHEIDIEEKITTEDTTSESMIPQPALITEVEELTLPVDSLEKMSSIFINNNDAFAKSTQVEVMIQAPGATKIKVSNTENLSSIEWQPKMSPLDWQLTEGDGYKRVYLQLLYPNKAMSSILYDEIILDKTPPIAKFTVAPDSGIAGETIFSLNASESFHNFDLFLRWDWENDGVFDTDWEMNKSKVFQFPDGGGEKTVKLQVKSSGGWLEETTKQIVVFSRPKPELEISQDFLNPSQVTLDASNSFDFEDGRELSFRWNFNSDSLWDVQWSTMNHFTKQFDNFDEQQIIVEIKDSHGLSKRLNKIVKNKFRNMVFIPAGTFTMGSNDFEIDESPEHQLLISEFWVDKFPVTNSEYIAFLNDIRIDVLEKYINLNGDDIKIDYNNSIFSVKPGFEKHPVTQVTWYGAKAYAEYYGKDLPTEAEWEKVARGTDKRLYPWGNEIRSEHANYWDSGDPYDNNTTPVDFYDGQVHDGVKKANGASPYGVYDLVGNVREWCQDWYQRDFYIESPSDNPRGPGSGDKKVVRGGGYLFYPEILRVTFRSSYDPTTPKNYIGFRCVVRKGMQ